MRLPDIVSKDPDVHSGDLVFKGTRVPAVRLVSYLQKGYSLGEFVEQFPSVSHRQAQAFLEWGLDMIEDEIDREQATPEKTGESSHAHSA